MRTYNTQRNSRRDRRSKAKAFTLIELLVIIAILSVLAAILFPVFARARDNARRATCMSNLKQIAFGVMQYTQDYNETFPIYKVSSSPPYTDSNPCGWADALQPYLKSTQIYQCPSEPTPPSDYPMTATSTGAYIDYSYNLELSTDAARNYTNGRKLADLSQPSLTVLNFDGYRYTANSWDLGCGLANSCVGTPINNKPALAVTNKGVAERHLGGQNYSFCDGHVKWFKGNQGYISAAVYNAVTPGSMSGNNPTFNPTP